jgi:hypothetical protein
LHFTQGRPYPTRLGPSSADAGTPCARGEAEWKPVSPGRIAEGIDPGADPGTCPGTCPATFLGTAGCDDGVEFMKLLPGTKARFAPLIPEHSRCGGPIGRRTAVHVSDCPIVHSRCRTKTVSELKGIRSCSSSIPVVVHLTGFNLRPQVQCPALFEAFMSLRSSCLRVR